MPLQLKIPKHLTKQLQLNLALASPGAGMGTRSSRMDLGMQPSQVQEPLATDNIQCLDSDNTWREVEQEKEKGGR